MKGDKMKKLLLVLLVVALAAFLLVGCIPGGTVPPVTPVAGTDCPTTVKVSGEVLIAGKNYLKGGVSQTITVTFAVETAPVSVYVGADIDDKAAGLVPSTADEVVMYTTDNKVYTGTYTFKGLCATDYIYVETCGTCAACKYPYTVDSVAPAAPIRICAADCAAICGGCALTFASTTTTAACTETSNCVETCSGLATWNIDIYSNYDPTCCSTACGGALIDSSSGTTCPISWTTACLSTDTGDEIVYAIVTLADKVGNSAKFGYKITQTWVNHDTCSTVTVTDLDATACLIKVPHVPCLPCVSPINIQ
jgi:hypothetical protein